MTEGKESVRRRPAPPPRRGQREGRVPSSRGRRWLNGRAAGIAALVGLWAVLELMKTGSVVEHRAVRCGEQLATAAHNRLQRITVVAEAGAPTATHLFHREPAPLDPEDATPDTTTTTSSSSNNNNAVLDTDADAVVVRGSHATAAEDLAVGAHVLQRVCVRRGSRVHYRATTAAPARRLSLFVFDCAAHLGDFANPRLNFTRRRGALVRTVVPSGTPAVFAATDDTLFATSPGSSFVDLCIAARNNVVATTNASLNASQNASSARGWAVLRGARGAGAGAVLPGVRLHVGGDFVQSDVRDAAATCVARVCEYQALHAPEGRLVALTQVRGRCADGDVAVVSTFVWYSPWVHAAAAVGAACVAYVLLAVVVPSAFHLVEKNKPKHE